MNQPYDYARADREAAMSRADLILTVKSLRAAAEAVRSLSLSVSYDKQARQLMARHSITEEEVA